MGAPRAQQNGYRYGSNEKTSEGDVRPSRTTWAPRAQQTASDGNDGPTSTTKRLAMGMEAPRAQRPAMGMVALEHKASDGDGGPSSAAQRLAMGISP